MRVKIKGKITKERLCEAFEAAVKKYENLMPNHQVYGANLYLTAFDENGLPFDIVDKIGRSYTIIINTAPGEPVKPILTYEGELKLHKKKQLRLEEKLALQKSTDEWNRKYEELKSKKLVEKQKMDNAKIMTENLLKNIPENLVIELNNIVQQTWSELKPVETKGKLKGSAKPIPYFFLHENNLSISTETWKNPRQVFNPANLFWSNDAWKETAKRIYILLEELTDSFKNL